MLSIQPKRVLNIQAYLNTQFIDDISVTGYFKKLFAFTKHPSVITDIYILYICYIPSFCHIFPVRFRSADKKVSFKDRAHQ